MPLFEYVCESCGHRTEVLQRIADPPLETCLECGGRMKKLLSAPAFQFKGSGWYVTDYAKKSSQDSPPAKSEAGSGEGSSSSAAVETSEAKPAPKETSAKAPDKPTGSSSSD